jgi:outer membrane protein OmpA-like peptidoglycan-associated protein
MKLFLTIFALLSILISGCATDKENDKTVKGAGIGAGAGALLGGIVGNNSGKRNEGALIGGAIGAALGGVVGHRMDQQAKELDKIAETKRTDQGLVTKLKSDILFDTGKASLKPAAQKNITQMAEIMKKYPENVLTVKGFTDSTGSTAVNNKLSGERAESVKKVLIASGMPANTISSVGMGEASPVSDNKSAAGRKKNRRVEIEVTVDPSKVPKEK